MKPIIDLANLNIASDEVRDKKILIFTDYINATYYQAFYYPFTALSPQENIQFYTWSQSAISQQLKSRQATTFFRHLLTTHKPDIVVFNRYALPCGRLILQECQAAQIPTIYFIDDDLLHIPTSLGKEISQRQGNLEVIAERKYLLANVNFIYASTDYLSRKLAENFTEQQVIVGIYPPYLEALTHKAFQQRKYGNKEVFRFGYMASRGHQQDLAMILPDLIKILTNYPQTEFATYGTISLPQELASFGKRVKAHAVVPYHNFLSRLYELNWDLGLAPLADTEFNRCKSVVKYLEYTACDIPVLASNSLVYNQIINSSNGVLVKQNNWYKNIELILNNPEQRQEIVKQAKVTCSEQFGVDKTSQEILKVIALLTNSTRDNSVENEQIQTKNSTAYWQAYNNILKTEKYNLQTQLNSLQDEQTNLRIKLKKIKARNLDLKQNLKMLRNLAQDKLKSRVLQWRKLLQTSVTKK